MSDVMLVIEFYGDFIVSLCFVQFFMHFLIEFHVFV